jgi:hypothetical protein
MKHITKKTTTKEKWYMTDDNWRYFKEFVAEIMSDIEAAEAQVEKDGG